MPHETKQFQGTGAPQIPAPPGWPAPIGDAAYANPIGEYVRAIASYTEASSDATLFQGVGLMGAHMGRGATYLINTTHHFPNIFLQIVGNTSRSRKGTSADNAQHVFSDVPPVRVMWGLSTGEGLLNQIADPDPTKDGNLPFTIDSRLVIRLDETDVLVKVLTREGNTLAAFLRQAWDGKAIETPARTNYQKCEKPHVAMICQSTVMEYRSIFRGTNLSNGLLNRFNYCMARRERLDPRGTPIPSHLSKEPAKQICRALEWLSDQGEIVYEFDREVQKLWDAWYRSRPDADHSDTPLDLITGRVEPQLCRYAMIFACLDRSPIIRRPHYEAALALIDFSIASARYLLGQYETDELQRLEQEIADSQGGLTKTAAHKIFHNKKPVGEIDRMLRTLVEQNRVTELTIETPDRMGRKRREMRFVSTRTNIENN